MPNKENIDPVEPDLHKQVNLRCLEKNDAVQAAQNQLCLRSLPKLSQAGASNGWNHSHSPIDYSLWAGIQQALLANKPV